MRNLNRTFGLVALLLASLAVASPVYAHKKVAPSMSHDMMKGGEMDGMMGMMSMMEQMNKMMALCTKMMANNMDGHHMKMPMEMPKKKS